MLALFKTKKVFIFILVMVLYFTASAQADTTIIANIDKQKLTTDEVVTYKLTIKSSENKLPGPKLPEFEGFNFISSLHSSSMSLGENGVNTTLVYEFILAPLEIGKLKIGPSSIEIKNETSYTDSFEIEVTQGKAIPKPEERSLPKKIPSQKESVPQYIL